MHPVCDRLILRCQSTLGSNSRRRRLELRGDVVPTHNGHIPTDMSSAAGGQRHPRGQAGRISSCGGSAFTGPFGVCYQGSLKLPAQQPHNLIASASPKSCCCSCALTRDSLAARLPRWSATVLHGLRAGLRRLHAVPLQEVMVLMTSYINLLVGSKPRTLPIRPSMTTCSVGQRHQC